MHSPRECGESADSPRKRFIEGPVSVHRHFEARRRRATDSGSGPLPDYSKPPANWRLGLGAEMPEYYALWPKTKDKSRF